MDHKQMHQYAVTYHCGKDWGEEMVQSVDLGHALEAAHAIFPRFLQDLYSGSESPKGQD